MRDGKGLSLGRVQDEAPAIKLLSKDSTRTSTGIRLPILYSIGCCIKFQPEQNSVKAEISIVGNIPGGMGASGSNIKEGILVKPCLACFGIAKTCIHHLARGAGG